MKTLVTTADPDREKLLEKIARLLRAAGSLRRVA